VLGKGEAQRFGSPSGFCLGEGKKRVGDLLTLPDFGEYYHFCGQGARIDFSKYF